MTLSAFFTIRQAYYQGRERRQEDMKQLDLLVNYLGSVIVKC